MHENTEKLVSDPFSILQNISMLPDRGAGGEFNGTLASVYIIIGHIAVIGILVSIIICGLKFATSNNPSTREETKKELLWKSVLAIIIFGFTYFASIAYNISKVFI